MSGGRRSFLERAALVGLGGWLSGRNAGAQGTGGGSPAVHTPHLPKLPFRMEGGVKVFDLVAEPVKREFLPGRASTSGATTAASPGPPSR